MQPLPTSLQPKKAKQQAQQAVPCIDTATACKQQAQGSLRDRSRLSSVCWQAPEVGHSSGDTSGGTPMSPDDVEGMLLMAVDKLYREDRELDVQMGLLSVVLQVLQRHGKPMLPLCGLLSVMLQGLQRYGEHMLHPCALLSVMLQGLQRYGEHMLHLCGLLPVMLQGMQRYGEHMLYPCGLLLTNLIAAALLLQQHECC